MLTSSICDGYRLGEHHLTFGIVTNYARSLTSSSLSSMALDLCVLRLYMFDAVSFTLGMKFDERTENVVYKM